MEDIAVIKAKAEQIVGLIVDNFEIVVEKQDETYFVNIKTEADASVIIGHHGETIQSIQRLLDVSIYKALGSKLNMLVNVNDYQERRRERIYGIVDQAITRMDETGLPANLRGFSSFERRIIHEYLVKQYPDLESYSVGEGRDRRLVIRAKS